MMAAGHLWQAAGRLPLLLSLPLLSGCIKLGHPSLFLPFTPHAPLLCQNPTRTQRRRPVSAAAAGEARHR
jgi:hypothetical protein